jgi:hypothetical protein
MSPPRNPGAANFNRLMNLSRRLTQVEKNHILHELSGKQLVNAYRASERARNRAGTAVRRAAAQRQLNRMRPSVNNYYARSLAMVTQRNNIRRQIGQLLGHTGHINMMAEIRQNNTLAQIRRMQGTRLAQMIENMYLRPSGMYMKKRLSRMNKNE